MPTKLKTHWQRIKPKKSTVWYPRESHGDPFYWSTRWRSFRKMFLHRYPVCCDPFGYHKEDGRMTAAAQVHHLKPRKQFPGLALSEQNCRGLCDRCHTMITRLEGKSYG